MKAYLYDMDGVLCDSEAFIAEAACRWFKQQHGVPVQPSDFEPFVGTGEDRYLGGVAEKYGVPLNLPQDKQDVYDIYARIVPGRMTPIAGVIPFIRAVRNQGWRQAVATSADPFKMKVNLAALGLRADDFDACVTGADVENKKPAPDIFLEAARACGVAPEACTVFEDAVNGVKAAKAAGMRCVAIASFFTPELLRTAGADDVWNDFLGKQPWS